MTDLQFRYLMNLYGGGGGGFTPGGGTFPPGGGAGSDFSNIGQPFGQTGPGFTDDLGHPMHPLPGSPPTEMTDRNLIHPFDNMLAMDAGMVQNPDFPFAGLGDDQKVYDPNEMQSLIDSLRQSSPSSLPNPAPPDGYFPGVPYGQQPDVPVFPYNDMQFPPGLVDPSDLFNPNTAPTDSGMETIAYSGAGGEWPPLPPDLNFAAPDVPQQYPTPSEFQGDTPLYGSNPSGYEPMPFDMFSDIYGGGGGNVTADQLGNVPSDLPGSVSADQLANPPGVSGDDFQWPFYVDQFPTPGGISYDDTGNEPTSGGGVSPSAYSDPNAYAPTADMIPGTNLPNAPGFSNAYPSGGMQDQFGNVIPGTDLSARDQANIINSEQFPGGGGVGGFLKDAAGNIIDSTGKIIATAADFASKFGGSIGNLVRGIPGAAQQFGQGFLDSLPKDLGGFGQPAGYFGVEPGLDIGYRGADTPGPGGGTGSVANFGITSGDIAASGVSPTYGNFAPGQVGRSSVPAPGGWGGSFGGGSYANPAALGGANSRGKMLAERIRQAIIAGTYRPPPFHGVYKYPSPVLQRAGIGLARNMGMVRTSGHFGGPMSFAPPGASAVNWATIGRSMPNFYAGQNRETFMGSAIGVGTRGFGTPHAHTPQTSPT